MGIQGEVGGRLIIASTYTRIVVKLAQSCPRELAVNFPETVRPVLGSTAYTTLYGSTTRAAARLRQLSDAADPQTRTFEARYVLEGADADAPLGATVTIRLETGKGSDSLEVVHRFHQRSREQRTGETSAAKAEQRSIGSLKAGHGL